MNVPFRTAPILLAAASLAVSAHATTVPSKRVTVVVQITDRGMKLTQFQAMEGTANPELVVLRGPIARGNFVSFNVVNQSRKAHDFVFLGRRTKRIEPGQTGHLSVTVLARGRFAYRSTLDKAPGFRGYVTVY
jgi:hypothetical protein